MKRFILICCGGRVILQEAACVKISRPVDWSVTVICGSFPEVMGGTRARERQPDRLLRRRGWGPGGQQDLWASARGGPFSAFNLAAQPVAALIAAGPRAGAPGDRGVGAEQHLARFPGCPFPKDDRRAPSSAA